MNVVYLLIGCFLIIQFECDLKYDFVHSTCINEKRDAVIYHPQDRQKSLCWKSKALNNKDDPFDKFKSYNIFRICAGGSK